MAGKKMNFVCKFGGKRTSKFFQLREARNQRWNKQNTGDVTTVTASSVDAIGDVFESASSFKLQKHQELTAGESLSCIRDSSGMESSSFLLVDLSQLSGLVRSIPCPFCQHCSLIITEGKTDFGVAAELFLNCIDCNSTISSCLSSKRICNKQNSSFEVTKRVVTSMLDIGVGFAGLEKFCGIMGMKCLNHKTFNKHCKAIKEAVDNVADDTLQLAANIVRQAYCETTEAGQNDILDICVSYDGSWMKRGHTSNFGVAVDILTGLVLDYEVLSKYCHGCANSAKLDKPEYDKWKISHICDKNFDGSSGAMEAHAAELIWKRSVEKHSFRYTTVLSDGDSKTFNHLTELQEGLSYGPGKF